MSKVVGGLRLSDAVAALDLPPHEAKRILALHLEVSLHALGVAQHIPPDVFHQAQRSAQQRRSGVPLQYLEGTVDFGPLNLKVDARVLIPRPETEYLWELCSRIDPEPELIVDVGTGSGALALSLANSYPKSRVIATDISTAALDLAQENAQYLGLEVEFGLGSLFDPLPAEVWGSVDLLVSNPPYLSEQEWAQTSEEVRENEPKSALVAGSSGTEIIEDLLSGVGGWLSERGQAILEIGEQQAPWLESFARQCLADIPIHRSVEVRMDLNRRPRYLWIR